MAGQNTTLRLRWHYLLIVAILAVNTTVLVGDFSARMALNSGDDSPLAAANFMHHPQFYSGDAWINSWIHIAMGSMQTWLTVGLYNVLGVPPEITYYFWVFLQNILLGVAVFRLSLAVKPSLTAAWLSVAFTFLAKPFVWDLAGYNDLMYTAYAGHLALPFLLLALASALECKTLTALALMTLGGLFHPPLAFYTGCMLGLFWLWEYRGDKGLSILVRRLAGLGLAMVICIIPTQLALYGMEQAPDSEMLPLVLRNPHTVPWLATAYLPAILHNFFKLLPLLLMAFLALRHEGLSKRVKPFWGAAFVATLVLIALQVIFSELRIMFLMRLILHRSSQILAMLAVPLAMNYLVATLNQAGWMERFVAAAALMSPGKYLMLALGAVSAPLSFQARPSRVKLLNRLAWLRFLGYGLALVLVLPNFATRATYYFSRVVYHLSGWDPGYLSIPALEHVSVYVPVTAALAAWSMGWASRREGATRETGPKGPLNPGARPWAWAWGLVIVVACSGAVYFSHVRANMALAPEARDWHQVQQWARGHTAPSARFTLAGTYPFYSWRSYANRPVAPCYRVMHYYMYTLEAREYDQRLERFFKKKCGISKEDWLSNNVHSCFLGLDKTSLQEFAREFGTDYLVTRKENKLRFPVAYQNSTFIVYNLRG